MNEKEISKIAVIGGGGWGTTLGNLLAEKGMEVDLWVREQEVFDDIKARRRNEMFLPGVELVPGLRPVRDFEEAVRQKDLVMMAVPSHVFRGVLLQVRPFLRPGMRIVSGTKGIENETLMVMSQVAGSVLPKDFVDSFATLAGPSFAREVSRRYPTAVTIACGDLRHAERLQRLFSTEFFRVYASQDLMGTELGGALKNVIAIAAGVSDGLHFGHNTRAALITRGLAEMSRLGVAMGAHPLTFSGLAGMGDLVLTCTGDLSRNRTVGLKIAQGLTLQEITSHMNMVAEGVRSTLSAYHLARKVGVSMPITTEVFHILYQGKDPRQAVRDLMGRELRAELEH